MLRSSHLTTVFSSVDILPARYYYAIRFVKKQELQLRNSAMARAVTESCNRDFWKEVYKRRNKTIVSTDSMDDVVRDDNVSKLFAEKYELLYNSIKYKNDEFNQFFNNKTCDITNECIPTDDHYTSQSVINKHTHAIIVEHVHVQYAIFKLKIGKSDCVENLYSDNFNNGTERFPVLLSYLLSSMLAHGVAPAGLLLSTMISIPKSKRGQNGHRIIIVHLY